MLKSLVVAVALTSIAPFAFAQSSHHYEATDEDAAVEEEEEPPKTQTVAPAPGRASPRVFRVTRPGVIHAEPNEAQAPAPPSQPAEAVLGTPLGGAGMIGGASGGPIGQFEPMRPNVTAGGSGGAGGGGATERDPGKGLWMPKGKADLFVVDPGNSLHSTVEQLPGTINVNGLRTFTEIEKERPGWKTKDFYAYPPTGAVVSFKPGNTISLRFRTGGKPVKRNSSIYAPGSVGGYFSFNNFDGGNFPFSGTISASVAPGDFSDAKCALSFRSNSNPRIFIESIPPLMDITGASLCIIPPNTDYYLNIRIDNRNGSAVTRRIKGEDGRYVWTPFTDAEIKNADCRNPTIYCPIMKLVPTGSVLEFFGGADPFAGSAPVPKGPDEGAPAPADASSCALPDGGALAAGGGYARLWYKRSGCVEANFVCRNGALAYGPSQFSPAPTPPAPGANLYLNQASCN